MLPPSTQAGGSMRIDEAVLDRIVGRQERRGDRGDGEEKQDGDRQRRDESAPASRRSPSGRGSREREAEGRHGCGIMMRAPVTAGAD